MSTETLDNNTRASHPGGLRISLDKLRLLHPELDSRRAWRRFVAKNPEVYPKRSFWRVRVEEQLLYGDSRAAVVVSTEPLLVAAYTDELDCVALLRFPDSFVEEYDLETGSRLLTVNTYFYPNESHAEDLQIGPNAYGRYVNFNPFIADFLTDDVETLEQRKADISEDEWRKTAELGERWLNENLPPRDGRPLLSSFPSDRPPAHSKVQFSVSHILDNLLGLMIFILMTSWSVRVIGVNPTVGWVATILFGGMSVLMVVEIVRICGADEAPPVDLKRSQRVRRALVQLGTVIVAIFLGITDVFIAHWLNNSMPALWLAAFVTNLAFYPLRGELKRNLPDFRRWAIYCAVMGVGSVVLSYFTDWLTTGLGGT